MIGTFVLIVEASYVTFYGRETTFWTQMISIHSC